MRKLSLLILVGGTALAACGGPDMNDASHDARVDARSDAHDATADVRPDVPGTDVQPPSDTGVDVVSDSGTDVVSDTGTDAGADAMDAASDTGTDVTVVDAHDSATDVPVVTDGGSDVPVVTDSGSDVPVVTDTGVDVPVVTDSGCTPATEVCNGRDDDCNGTIDDVAGCGTHLLISEVASAGTPAEFVEIFNPTSAAIDLSNVYVSDWEQYYTIVAATPAVATADFVARFPAGASIAPGAYQTVAIAAAADFHTSWTVCPTYSLLAAASTDCATTQTMRSARTTSTIGSSAVLTNGNEPIIVFQWNGTSDLVTDLDYVYYGTPTSANPQVDKTLVSIDGPDVDALPSVYLADTAAAAQQHAEGPPSGGTAVRCDFTEGTEVHALGNGLGGHNETSEPMATTFRVTDILAHDGGDILLGPSTPGARNNCH